MLLTMPLKQNMIINKKIMNVQVITKSKNGEKENI